MPDISKICLICSFIYGLIIGSFLNVLIIRFGTNESPAKGRSHCMKCNHTLAWYDNIPLFSWLFLKGKCRYCHEPISIQYPVVEALNAFLWSIIFMYSGIEVRTICYMVMSSALIVISFVDEKCMEIPVSQQIVLQICGVVNFVFDLSNWSNHIIGALCVSVFLLIIFLVTLGRGIGFGDVKLMFLLGLLLGWKRIIVGFLVGCIIAIIIHSVRMKFSDKEHILAFGPYLCIGSFLSLFVGEFIFNIYLSILGV